MGSYASLKISSFEVYSCKSYIDPLIMTFFRELDREQRSWFDEEGEERVSLKYRNKVSTMKLRFDIMGFNLFNTINEFKIHNDKHFCFPDYASEEYEEISVEEYTFENWLNAMKVIVNSAQYYFELKEMIQPKENPILYHVLYEQNDGNSLYGFNCSDIRYVFRGILELFNDEDEFCLDYSDLVDGGYYSEGDKICEISLQSLANHYITNEKIIIISEGSSDITVIKRTMEILYPDIVDFYSFMDFDQSNASGSASSLVSYIKAFIGSGIRNKIIALFDNDTAAEEAISVLNKISIPANIKVLRYPYLELASQYPTIGPNGVGFTDINGLACSIELYLGRDILTCEEYVIDYPTKYIPVQWKGYNQGLKKYQGEILNKEQILKKYFTLLDKINVYPELKEQHDWQGLGKVIRMIFSAFNDGKPR
ncbi:HEPN/Toprim-associated domain-containing protein [Brevibacillus brevis]|uniref:HEPN/Toprim-associated domain-containing protein n=1 Tax=Brevibacillus brevis TaxID=1393 RepID=UPI0037C6D489